jgi:biopolymer transport protein ExbD
LGELISWTILPNNMVRFRMARDRRKLAEGGVSINLTAMLDMAFQLLAFFVLTYRPAPLEGEVSLRIPPPRSVVAAPTKYPHGEARISVNAHINSIVITALPNKSGKLGTIMIFDQPIGTLAALDNELQNMLTAINTPFEQVVIQVGSNLRHDALMSVLDTCSRQKLAGKQPLTKLSLVELTAN